MKTRKTLNALWALALMMLCPSLLFSQIYTPGGNVLNNTGGSAIGIGTDTPVGKLEVNAEGDWPATLLLQNTQSMFSGGGEPTEPAYALKVMRQMLPSMGLPGPNNTIFTVDPTGRTTIGTFPAAAPDMLAVGGSLGLFLSPTNFMRMRTTSTGAEMIWNTNNNSNLSFKSHNTGITGMLLSPDGKFAVGSNNLVGDHRLRVEGSAVLDQVYIQQASGWGTNTNFIEVKHDFGPEIRWESSDDENLRFHSNGINILQLSPDGKVGINTDHFVDDHSLYVEGSMLIEEIVVKKRANWGDFVFEPDYPLMPLSELDAYLAEHKHLPAFPSAAEVAENGFALGETQRLLTIKVEELTLYLLQMSREMEALREEITTLRGEK